MRDELQEILTSHKAWVASHHSRIDDYRGRLLSDQQAFDAILDLLDKSLPSHKRQVHVEHGQQMPSVAQCKWYFDGYDQALADVRKVIKEEL